MKIKECALLVCGGEKDETNYEGIVKSYKLIARFLSWKDCGVIIVPGLHEFGTTLLSPAITITFFGPKISEATLLPYPSILTSSPVADIALELIR